MNTTKTMHDNGTAPPAVGSRIDRRVRPRVERLRWWDAQRSPPDHDNTVLVLLRDARPFSQPWWTTGYWDKRAELWRDDNMMAFAVETVALYWAEPDGPSGA